MSKEGVLTSDLTGIQDAANLNLLLLDKTGTITENKTAVASWTDVSDLPDKDVLALVGAATDKRNAGIIDTAIDEYLKEKDIPVMDTDNFVPLLPTLVTQWPKLMVTTLSWVHLNNYL